ncbi:glutathione S-transferase Mu 1-like isoform X3 [Podarcis raffonei]|uniref:glutathione S-transferase Mu 1-like isoform X3 n=1 Tax=Podarcis raffonei TaxID=65483 RepID=UPI0023293E9C|nr:glutathione S-transferase Mu 1-like isoform X3 [Podarcis raffonei]
MGVTLGYWDIRGLAHAIRLLLEYTGTTFEDKQYAPGDAPEFDASQWLNAKETLGLDFPNLPYLIDGETKITQSNAIMRYIARKHKMCGESEEEMVRIDMLENHIMDLRMAFAKVCYSPDFEKLKPEYLEQIPGKLKLLSQFLGDKKWFAGKKITYVDFLAYDILDQHRMFEPKYFDEFPNLKDFLSRFEALEKISAYMKSDRFMKAPIFWRLAKWSYEKV